MRYQIKEDIEGNILCCIQYLKNEKDFVPECFFDAMRLWVIPLLGIKDLRRLAATCRSMYCLVNVDYNFCRFENSFSKRIHQKCSNQLPDELARKEIPFSIYLRCVTSLIDSSRYELDDSNARILKERKKQKKLEEQERKMCMYKKKNYCYTYCYSNY